MGTFTLNTQTNNINACPGETITIGHTGWNNGGGTMAYYVGTENPVNSGWVSTWDVLSGACSNQNSCSFTVPNVPDGTRLIVHSNAFNGCWGPGVTRIVTVTCCATTNAGTIQNQNTTLNLCSGQTVSANNIVSTSLNAGTGTLRTVWFVGEWGWTGTAMGWINWRESTPGAPAGGIYSSNLNTAVGGGNGDGQTMTNYNPQIDFPNNNRFYIIRGSYNPTCASWCIPACVYQGFEVRIASPIPSPTATMSPLTTTVCAGETLTLTSPTLGSGGTGTCNIEYRYSTNNGTSWSNWSTSVSSFTAVEGTNLIEIRTNCNGSGCDISSSMQYSWTVNQPPSINAISPP
jgi:hypothetical protein